MRAMSPIGPNAKNDALAWISTARDEANISGLSGLLDDAEGTAVPPGDGDGLVDKAGGEDDREMGAAVEAHADLAVGYGDVGGHVDEVAEDLPRLSVIVAAHAVGHQAIEARDEAVKLIRPIVYRLLKKCSFAEELEKTLRE
jgi:hypothetical protein